LSLTPNMARRGSTKAVGWPKFGLKKLSVATASSAVLLSTFNTSTRSSTRFAPPRESGLDTRKIKQRLRRQTTRRVLILTVIIVLVPVISFRFASAQTSQNAQRQFRLQINAANGASIRVRGAVWMDGTITNVTVVDQQTPFDMETLGTVANGILKVDGRDPVRVQVTDEATGTQTLSAEGHAIIVGQGLAPNSGWAFIRTEK
jgi:type II secretory pathway pseudopilin PulG